MALQSHLLDLRLDENKPRGFVEIGFTSATPVKDVALFYAGAADANERVCKHSPSALVRALETMEEELAIRLIPQERSVMLLLVSKTMRTAMQRVDKAHRSTLLEIETGQVDRGCHPFISLVWFTRHIQSQSLMLVMCYAGASLNWVSQFKAEEEHTLLPLSNFEVTGMRR